jgi:hypothetical protein
MSKHEITYVEENIAGKTELVKIEWIIDSKPIQRKKSVLQKIKTISP